MIGWMNFGKVCIKLVLNINCKYFGNVISKKFRYNNCGIEFLWFCEN